jgi:chorismate mutase
MKIELKLDKAWINTLPRPLWVAGPCSAESFGQLDQTIGAILNNDPIWAFRAGAWKPRTRPGSFEGIGSKALEWLKAIKDKYNIPVATEVANAQHVKEALEAGIDVLWLGARTTVNPFYVQDIANALRGVDIPVFVKNPLHPDLGLWMGALERLNEAGITKLVAVHRGFFSYDSAPYRNDPKWDVVIDLKRMLPELPILCDPSHIAGKPELVKDICQTALDLTLDGIMVETHIQPKEALSDSEQQITPKYLHSLMHELIIREPVSEDAWFISQLQKLRGSIDLLDQELIHVIARRMQLVDEIGEVKKENGVTIFQIERWLEILKSRKAKAQENDLNENFIVELFSLIHKHSIRRQTEIMHRRTKEDGV